MAGAGAGAWSARRPSAGRGLGDAVGRALRCARGRSGVRAARGAGGGVSVPAADAGRTPPRAARGVERPGSRRGSRARPTQDRVPASGPACGARATTASRRPAAALQPERAPAVQLRPSRSAALLGPTCVATGAAAPAQRGVREGEAALGGLRPQKCAGYLRVILRNEPGSYFTRVGPFVNLTPNTLPFGLSSDLRHRAPRGSSL